MFVAEGSVSQSPISPHAAQCVGWSLAELDLIGFRHPAEMGEAEIEGYNREPARDRIKSLFQLHLSGTNAPIDARAPCLRSCGPVLSFPLNFRSSR